MAGYAVDGAPDGISGLAAVETKHPDLIILDIKMPGMSGLDVLSRLKATHPEIAVFLFTGYGDYREAAQALGADGYFVKSANLAPMIEVIRRALNHNH